MGKKIKIEIWSDVVCPFCYLGFRKLEHALKKTGLGGYFETEWQSFQLDPEYPSGQSESTTSYLAQRKGVPESQIRQIYSRLTEQGKIYGIDFHFDTALTFNTRKAHQLIQWSKNYSNSTELEVAFFKAYFTNGANLSIPENLITIAESVGLNGEDARFVLNDQKHDVKIEEDKYAASQLGVRGVPYFLIGGEFPIAGAMPDEVFENTLRMAAANHLQANDQ